MPRSEFSKATKLEAMHRSQGKCEACLQDLAGRTPEYDHILPDYMGGSNDLDNCQVLCPKCHGIKTRDEDRPRIDKTRRIIEKSAGVRKTRGFRRPPRGWSYDWSEGRYRRGE